jgi:hypothetical protein
MKRTTRQLIALIREESQEANRLATLTHEQLVREVLSTDLFEHLLIREMMNRLDPKWMELTPEEQAQCDAVERRMNRAESH